MNRRAENMDGIRMKKLASEKNLKIHYRENKERKCCHWNLNKWWSARLSCHFKFSLISQIPPIRVQQQLLLCRFVFWVHAMCFCLCSSPGSAPVLSLVCYLIVFDCSVSCRPSVAPCAMFPWFWPSPSDYGWSEFVPLRTWTMISGFSVIKQVLG